MDKLKMHSPDISQSNIEKIRELFPGCVTESKDENGSLRYAVDFDQLRQELSDHVVDGPQERYRLDWPGKREALFAANAPIAKTFRPYREKSKNFEAAKNILIEGDNLEALKLLQETYLGKVKLIYIDPPYNTGNDYIYRDNYADRKDEYFLKSNQTDNENTQLVANPESSGRFHSAWLSLMYSRLKLARNLLKDTGVMFISIDDGEVGNLRKICDEIFGEANLIANIVWQKKYTRSNDARWFSDNHDHILCYAKQKIGMTLNLLPRNEEQLKAYGNPDNDPRGPWKATPLHAKSGSNTSPYTFKTGKTWAPPRGTYRRFSDNAMAEMEANNQIWFGSDGQQTPSRKTFLNEAKAGVSPVTIWPYDEVGHNHEANSELKEYGIGGLFDNPKPTRLIERMLTLATNNDDVVLDFFAGSGTTAEAVMKKNSEDGGNRKFILVQLDEPCEKNSAAAEAGYETVSEICRERVAKAAQRWGEASSQSQEHGAYDYRVLRIDTSNMAETYYKPEDTQQGKLLASVNSVKRERENPDDLLFQVLLDWGVDLTLPIKKNDIQGREVFFVNEQPHDLIACFDHNVSEELVKELAGYEPLRVVFRDNGFDSDAVKINVEQIFNQLSPHTDVKSI
jgi:adenine-specific DNA-methyltransferase